MNSSVRVVTAAAVIAVSFLPLMPLMPATASAEPTPEIPTPEPAPEVLHNITYRARIDGVARGATVSWAAQDNQTQTESPTMVPGRVFEAQTVLPASGVATMRLSIEWPYSANLHCEILIDDVLVSQADDFIAPRVLPQRDDPEFGSLTCEAPVAGIPNPVPVDPAAPPPGDALPSVDPNLPPA